MLGNRWPHKPPFGYQIDADSALAQGLMGFYALNEGDGPKVNDSSPSGLTMATSGPPVWSTNATGPILSCPGYAGMIGASASLPPGMRIAFPMTIAMGIQRLGTPSAYSVVGGILQNATNAAPYYTIAFTWQGGANTTLTLNYSTPGNHNSFSGPVLDTNPHVIGGEINAAGGKIYVDGLPNTTAPFTPTAQYNNGTPVVAIGYNPGTAGQTAASSFSWFAWWDRVLQPAEHAALAANPWRIFEPRRGQVWFPEVAATPFEYIFSGPSHAFVTQASGNFTVAPTLVVPSDTVTPSDGGSGGTFTPSSLTFTATSAPKTFTYTAASKGVKTLGLTSAASIPVVPSSLSCTIGQVPVNYTLAGPSGGLAGSPSSNFTLTPASSVDSDAISLSDGGSGGTFAPSSLTFIATSAAKTFSYTPTTPGAKTLTATSSYGGTISGSPTTYTPTPIPGSIRFLNQCTYSTGSTSLLSSQSSATLAFRVQFNSAGSGPNGEALITLAGNTILSMNYSLTILANYFAVMLSGPGGTITGYCNFQYGIPNHVVISWANGAQSVYINGALAASQAFSGGTSAYGGALTIGNPMGYASDFQLSDLAIWNGYAATSADVVNLYAGVYTPKTLATPATAWFPLGGPSGAHPNYSDSGFDDWTGHGYTFASSAGTTSNAQYAGVLGFVPPVAVSAYVSKSGKLAMFFPVAAAPASNGYHVPQVVTGVASNPTITWNGAAIEADGPTWDSANQVLPFVAYRLQCGSVQSVGIANGGTGYVSPTVTASGGGATAQATFGTPVLNTGVTAYTVGGVGSYGQYTTVPSLSMSGASYTGTAPSARVALSGTTLSVVPTVGGLLGCGSGVTAGPSTLSMSGGLGSGATATATLTGGIAFLALTAGGSGYTSGSVAVTISDSGSGTGATATATVSGGAVTGLTLTSPGSNYSSPTVTIANTGSGAGSGATATAKAWVAGGIAQPLVTAGGSGYAATGTTATVGGGGGSGATLAVTVVNGVVTGLTVTAPGSGYTSNPTIAISGSGTGATATCTYCKSGGIASVSVVSGGGGYSSTATTAYAIDTQGGTGSGATLGVSVSNGVVAAAAPTAAGTGYTHPAVAIQPGTGSGAKATATVTGGAIVSIAVNSAGSGYGLGTTVMVLDPNGTGASYTVNLSSGGVASFAKSSGGSGYTSPTVVVVDGAEASLTATVGKYIQSVPVVSGGSGYTSPPTLTVTDGSGTSAVLTPVMSGVESGDVLTYTAARGWLQNALGSVMASPPPGSSTPGSIANFAGSTEGQAGLLAGFPAPSTLQIGVNAGSVPTEYNQPNTPFVNYAKKSPGWSVTGGGSLSQTFDGQPISWTPTAATISTAIAESNQTNTTDNRDIPLLTGTWTLLYYDPDAANVRGNAATVGLTFNDDTGGTLSQIITVSSPVKTVSGNLVKLTYVTAYVSNPINFSYQVRLTYALPSGSQAGNWTISDLFVVPPGNDAFVAGFSGSSSPLAVDGNVAAWLTSPKAQTPAAVRFMDVNAFYGGYTNYIDPSDLASPSDFTWNGGVVSLSPPNSLSPGGSNLDPNGNPIRSGIVQWSYVRCYNTNPSDPTYAWSSPNLYYGEFGAWGVATGTDPVLGPYLTLPPSDNGLFCHGLAYNWPGYYAAVELVSAKPHGIKTGQLITLYNVPSIPFVAAGGATISAGIGPNQVEETAYVTGPNTVLLMTPLVGVPGFNQPTVSRVNSTTPIYTGGTYPSGFFASVQVPYQVGLPYEFSAAMCSALGSDLWISVPTFASEACSQAIAQRVAAHLTPGLKVYVEFGNESWNDTSVTQIAGFTFARLVSYFPIGTRIGNYYTTDGNTLPQQYAYAIKAANHHDIWEGVFSALGRGGDVVRLFGCQYTGGGTTTQAIIAAAQQYGFPVQAVAMAPYYNALALGSTDNPYMAACTAAGGPSNGGLAPGNWPADAMHDLCKHSVYYNTACWGYYAIQAACVNHINQPLAPLPASNPATTGGVMASGDYYFSCTFVDYLGRETTIGNSQVHVYITGGYVVKLQLPVIPPAMFGTGTATINLYATQANFLPSSATLYASGLASGSAFTLSSNTWASLTRYPPTTNQVPATVPQMVAYEAAVNTIMPGGVPFRGQIARDMFYHPAWHDTVTALLAAMQSGHPGVSGSGLSMACYFSLCYNWDEDSAIFSLAVSTSQPAGYGTSNLYSTAQGGAPADNACHDWPNQVPGIQALRDWMDALAPPAPSVVGTSPATGATAVPLSNTVVATFSEAIQPGTLAFAFTPSVAGMLSIDPTQTIVTFTPAQSGGFANGTQYTASVQATAANGVPMPSPYKWSWTTVRCAADRHRCDIRARLPVRRPDRRDRPRDLRRGLGHRRQRGGDDVLQLVQLPRDVYPVLAVHPGSKVSGDGQRGQDLGRDADGSRYVCIHAGGGQDGVVVVRRPRESHLEGLKSCRAKGT